MTQHLEQEGNLGESATADIVAKYHQVIKLELEALLKLKKWSDMDGLFQEYWKYDDPGQYETLADLLLVIYSCIENEDVERKHHDGE